MHRFTSHWRASLQLCPLKALSYNMEDNYEMSTYISTLENRKQTNFIRKIIPSLMILKLKLEDVTI